MDKKINKTKNNWEWTDNNIFAKNYKNKVIIKWTAKCKGLNNCFCFKECKKCYNLIEKAPIYGIENDHGIYCSYNCLKEDN